jgi:predicted nucleotidyltransferase
MDELDHDDDGATIERAGKALIEAVPAPAKVILFGSHARGEADDRSAFDFLVIEQDVEDRFGEMAKLNTILGHMLIPAEVVVASAEEVRRLGAVKGSLIHTAMSEGRVVAES